MGDILKEILKTLPDGKISETAFEGANIVLYTKSKEFFADNGGSIRAAVSQFKKRIELRPDPSLCIDQKQAEKLIKEMVPAEAGIDEFIFDPPRSQVIVHADKPGVVIGPQGALLREIAQKTFWVPVVRRLPPIKSKLIDSIRSVLYENATERKKFLDRTGHRVYDGWLREKKHEWVRISFLGAARQVGRTCFLVQTPESRILIDCGIDSGEDGPEMYPYLDAPEFNISDIDAIIVTHAHLDHSGLVPYLYKYGYRGPVYCTAPTRDVMALLQLDFIKIQRAEGKEPLYTSEEVRQMVLHTITLEFEEVSDITPDVRLTFYTSGHIIGSSVCHLNIGNGLHNMVYTSDLKYARTNVLEPGNTQFPRVETLLIESTYGGKDPVMSDEDAEAYIERVLAESFARGGKVLMPVLGSGRAQEIMVLVERLMRENKVPRAPIYIDGMIWDITAIHTAYPEFLSRTLRAQIFHKENNPFLSDIFKQVSSPKERQAVLESAEPCLVLATSGMLTGGPSVEYFRSFARSEKNAIIFTCYQQPGSLGFRIRSGEREVTYNEAGRQHTVPVALEVHKAEIISHSDRRQLLNYVKRCSPQPRKIMVVHGEAARCLDLASTIHKQFKIETTAPKNLDTVRIR